MSSNLLILVYLDYGGGFLQMSASVLPVESDTTSNVNIPDNKDRPNVTG